MSQLILSCIDIAIDIRPGSAYHYRFENCKEDDFLLSFDEGLRMEQKKKSLNLSWKEAGQYANRFFQNLWEGVKGESTDSAIFPRLHIEVPSDCETIEVDLVNRGVSLSGLSAGEIKVDLVNGRLLLEDCQAEDLHLDVVNGNISLKQVQVRKKAKIDTVNGNITLHSSLPEHASYHFETVTGKIQFQGAAASHHEVKKKDEDPTIKAETVNGSIYID